MNTINLNLIYQLLRYKQYHYAMSMTSNHDNSLYIDFTTSLHGGDLVELRLGEKDNDIRYSSKDKTDDKKNLSHEELIKYITNDVK